MNRESKIKLCVWMNIPSHYQSAFYAALNARDDVDLIVVYLAGASRARASEGWRVDHDWMDFERCVDGASDPSLMLQDVEDWRERTHVLNSYFSSALLDYFSQQGVDWCHWSETPGIQLAELTRYNMTLYRALRPLMFMLKRKEGRRVARSGLGALGQGELARRAFYAMGIPSERVADLYYAPAALSAARPSERIQEFAAGRKVFLSVGALCARKASDVLLKAFAAARSAEWCLVFCGLDKGDGAYQALAKKLGIEDQILFMGAYPADAIAEVYAAADVFVLPSRFDGWGAVLNEAASVGLPLIGTDLCGAAWHVIEPDVNGFRVKAGSVGELSRAMSRYRDDEQLRARHGVASRERFQALFTPEKNAERLVAALRTWGVA